MTTFGIVFLAALAAGDRACACGSPAPGAPRRARTADAVPPEFAGEISLDAHQKAADYTVAKTRFAMIDVVRRAR